MENFAFISYSRKDKGIANWIHSKLEKYPYPKDLVRKECRPEHKHFVRRIFIDTKDLPVTEERFNAAIKENLEKSRYLIVVCSEHSANSRYVENEIRYFLHTHGNDTSLVLPVFIDKVANSLPEPLAETNVCERNCPIYNSKLDGRSEANLYCFYHIAAFLLKVDFTRLYDRYERYARQKHNRKVTLGCTLVFLLLLVVSFLFVSLNRQRELTKFEKDIFPLSIVFGYTNNFLTPLIEYVKEKTPDAGIYILMPYCREDLQHQNRIVQMGEVLKDELGVDSVFAVNVPTRMKRGSRAGRIASADNKYENVYIDFASTTSTFAQIIDYKKAKYKEINANELIKEYTNTFIRQAKEQLGNDSAYVHFFVHSDGFVDAIRKKGEASSKAVSTR